MQLCGHILHQRHRKIPLRAALHDKRNLFVAIERCLHNLPAVDDEAR